MLLHTFRHLNGIGPAREKRLRLAGISNWHDLLRAISGGDRPRVLAGLSDRQIADITCQLRRDLDALESGRLDLLAGSLDRREHWRLYPHFADLATFLDIETTGTDPQSSRVTVVGIFQPGTRGGPQIFVDGYNLEQFPEAAREFKLLVTFNGSSFDLPMLRKHFPGIELPEAHADLRWVAYRAGLKGSLKVIEQRLGINRNPDVSGMDGSDAVYLWQAWMDRGDYRALERLVRYNLEDTVNLQRLFHLILELLYRKACIDFEPMLSGLIALERHSFWLDPVELLGRAGIAVPGR